MTMRIACRQPDEALHAVALELAEAGEGENLTQDSRKGLSATLPADAPASRTSGQPAGLAGHSKQEG